MKANGMISELRILIGKVMQEVRR